MREKRVSSPHKSSKGDGHFNLGRDEVNIKNFQLESGEIFPEITIAYESYGSLNSDGKNCVLIAHSLGNSQHALASHMGRPGGQWKDFLGFGKSAAIDVNKYFVIC